MTLIILAGGKNSRMGGRNKALLPLGKDTMINFIINRLSSLFQEIIIVAREVEPFSKYRVRVIQDQYLGFGPISGIHAGLMASLSEYNMVLACDVPLIKIELVEFLLNYSKKDLVIPKVGEYLEPLVAVYAKRITSIFEKAILENSYKLSDLFELINVDYVSEEKLRKIDPKLESFFNVNRPEDYKEVQKILIKN
ncbi:MAG: molybdenum cofactor guanylyltransferase [Halanaerobiales bacterium]|nr:molybdenum cofactor guanylyltransferase [Halanaerobiales bacterium]